MIDNASRSGDAGGFARWLAVVIVAAVVSSPPLGELAAKPLSEDDCASLAAEMQGLKSSGIELMLGNDPQWAKANLKPPDLKRISRFLTLEDEIAFRCRGADRVIARARIAKKTKGRARTSRTIPLPVRKPSAEEASMAEFIAGPHSVRASANEHLGAIAPATPRRVIKLPQLSAMVAPLPGLRKTLEPAELGNVEAETRESPESGAAADLGSILASVDAKADDKSPKAIEGPSTPLPERKPALPAASPAKLKPRAERVRRPPVQRVRRRATVPKDIIPSAASTFGTD